MFFRTNATLIKTDDLASKSYEELVAKYGELLKIPRRPKRDLYETADELNKLENEMFLDWRRNVSLLQESNGVVMTPFERNLELWRQLWRVVEKSDLIVQIVDARNPFMFRNSDLEAYVNEHEGKANMILVNKSDLLSTEHLQKWRKYFCENEVPAVFWAAKPGGVDVPDSKVVKEESEASGSDSDENGADSTGFPIEQKVASMNIDNDDVPFITSAEDLIQYFKAKAFNIHPDATQVIVGMVGYPNVGKSSTINRIYGSKKTSVSSTPGKTKHFQTLIVDDQLMLCDCPGLVMPSFGFSGSEMVLNCKFKYLW